MTTENNYKFPSLSLVTGGVRSGKSEYAEALALEYAGRCGQRPMYVATARIYDDEMRRRVHLHKERRANLWDSEEEYLDPGSLELKGRIVLLDCLTLWLTNIFMECKMEVDRSFQQFEKLFTKLLETSPEALIVVTNEIGLGGVASNEIQRKFTDLQGLANQKVASAADSVTLLVSGVPLHVK